MADTYTATEDIYVSRGVRAHRKGDVVPAANVKRNGWQDKVAKSTTKAAEQARAEVVPTEQK